MSLNKIAGKVVAIGTAVTGVVLAINYLLNGEKITKYGHKWFESISDEELDAEREQIRQDIYCNGDWSKEGLLNLFDNEQVRRMNEKFQKEHPDAKPRHREHGWYLDNDE